MQILFFFFIVKPKWKEEMPPAACQEKKYRPLRLYCHFDNSKMFFWIGNDITHDNLLESYVYVILSFCSFFFLFFILPLADAKLSLKERYTISFISF